jgi:hypothetical protein
MVFAAAATAAFAVSARAQAYEPPWWEVVEAENGAKQAACDMYGWCGQNGGGTTVTRIGVDPCYLAQNAMRPCTSKGSNAKPKGVDPNLTGTWEIPFKRGPWVLTIDRNGTYKFHSEAGDSVPANTGTFQAGGGHWSLKADKIGYADFGDYLFQVPNVFIATGQHGAVAWLRPELAKEAMRPCPPRRQPPPKLASKPVVDPHLLGTWQLPLQSGGPWVWKISSNGTYKFHSDGLDMATPHTGTFSAGDGKWSLTATTGLGGYQDSGNYLYQSPNVMMATGRQGAAAWIRPTASSCMP